MTWTYLNKHYEIEGHVQYYNKVYINLDRHYWELADVKKIAQAIIHFEPALELLVPDGLSRSDSWSNELPNNSFLGEAKKSRSQAIEAIAAIQDASKIWQMVRPIQERGHVYCCPCYYNSWSFVWRMVVEPLQVCTPEATSVAAAATSWADFARLFIQAALACRSARKLQDIPPNHEGLRHFMSGKRPALGSQMLRTYKSQGARW